MQKISTSIHATHIEYNQQEKILTITFNTTEKMSYSAEFLRVHSPSAEVQKHSMSAPTLLYGRKNVAIIDIENVGNYAIRLTFDDLHDSGIYSWTTLYDFGTNYTKYWDLYLARLQRENKSRTP